jgi:hypothetical protein
MVKVKLSLPMSRRHTREVVVYLHSLLVSALGGDEWPVPCLVCYTCGKEPLEVALVPELVWMFLETETPLVPANIEP